MHLKFCIKPVRSVYACFSCHVFTVYLVIDFLMMTGSISKLLHSWLFIDPSEPQYETQTSKFNKIFKSILHNVKQCL